MTSGQTENPGRLVARVAVEWCDVRQKIPGMSGSWGGCRSGVTSHIKPRMAVVAGVVIGAV